MRRGAFGGGGGVTKVLEGRGQVGRRGRGELGGGHCSSGDDRRGLYKNLVRKFTKNLLFSFSSSLSYNLIHPPRNLYILLLLLYPLTYDKGIKMNKKNRLKKTKKKKEEERERERHTGRVLVAALEMLAGLLEVLLMAANSRAG